MAEALTQLEREEYEAMLEFADKQAGLLRQHLITLLEDNKLIHSSPERRFTMMLAWPSSRLGPPKIGLAHIRPLAKRVCFFEASALLGHRSGLAELPKNAWKLNQGLIWGHLEYLDQTVLVTTKKVPRFNLRPGR
ncbi:MAG: hypothetical protein PHV34_04785 [Verrucomicrobiae bacterium]|nr:hypothetical protein [Verrucomicrobiae bacterium]